MFHENTELFSPGDSSDLSHGSYYPTEGKILVLVDIYNNIKLVWTKVEN